MNPPIGAHCSLQVAVRGPRRDDRGDDLSVIPCYSQHYIPLQYVLFCPHGTHGWTFGIRSRNSQHHGQVTLMEWVRYHLRTRSTHVNFFHLGRKLYQQYIVDEFERHQTQELNWFRMNQKTIRADLYNNLHAKRASYAGGNGALGDSGRVLILPASYTCSDRWYHCRYKNAMSIVRVKGPPSLFITVTMDVHCDEVKRLLKQGQTPYDRPDIICQVYELKKRKSLD